MSGFSWGVFLVLAVGAMCVALGIPFGSLILLIGVIVLAIAFRYPYASYYVSLALTPLLGLTISIPTGSFEAGERAFHGSIDLFASEVLLFVILVAWGLKIIFLWIRRRDHHWRPRLPLVWSYGSLVVAHALSVFSSLRPDALSVAKFTLRPVLFSYLAFIALPVNFLRSRRRMVSALTIMAGVGTVAALNGLLSLFFVDASSQGIHRAHPLPMFGVPVFGGNHNLLAELMVVSVFQTLALGSLVKSSKHQRWIRCAAILQLFVGLLTFARTAWIVFFVQVFVLAWVSYRLQVREHARKLFAIFLLGIPIVVGMVMVASSNIASSSDDTRIALLDIATQVFLTSPVVGGGAGSFVDLVGSAHVFLVEYGAPLDAHGFIQKLGAETGLIGLIAFLFVVGSVSRLAFRAFRSARTSQEQNVLLFLMTAAGGAVGYQLFNTNYWTGKMWLPIGLLLAAIQLFEHSRSTVSPRV